MAYRNVGRLSFSLFLRPPFLICAGIYAAYFLLQKLGWSISLLDYYLNDLLCMPLVLTLALFYQRHFTFKNHAYCFTPHHVLVAVAYYSLAFELVLPYFMERYTADWLDVLAYAAGGFFFYRFMNKASLS